MEPAKGNGQKVPIKIWRDQRAALDNIGRKRDTYSSILQRLLDTYHRVYPEQEKGTA